MMNASEFVVRSCRSALVWMVWNVPLGRAAPWVLGLAMGRWPSANRTRSGPSAAEERSEKAGDHVQCDADQAMIAAAPTMYVALKSIEGLLSAASMDDKSEAVRESNINLAWHEADRALATAESHEPQATLTAAK